MATRLPSRWFVVRGSWPRKKTKMVARGRRMAGCKENATQKKKNATKKNGFMGGKKKNARKEEDECEEEEECWVREEERE